MEEAAEYLLEYARNGSIIALALTYLALFYLVNQFVKSVVDDDDDRARFRGFLEARQWWEFYLFAVSKVRISLDQFFGRELISPHAFNRNLGISIAYPWFLIAFSIWMDPMRPLSDIQRNFMLAGAVMIFPAIIFLYKNFASGRKKATPLKYAILAFSASLLFLLLMPLIGMSDFSAVKECAKGSVQGLDLVQHAANSYFNCLNILPAHDFFLITAIPALAVSLNSILISNGGLMAFLGGILGLASTCVVAFPEMAVPVFLGIALVSYGIPLLNGCLDFISLVITRRLLTSLEADARAQSWIGAFKHLSLDLLAAIVVLSTFSLSLWAILNLTNQFPDVAVEWLGHSVAPWSAAAFPWSIMFLTVLIPTGIHLTFAAIAVSFAPVPMNPAGFLRGKRVSYLERLAVSIWFFLNVVIVTLMILAIVRIGAALFDIDGGAVFWRFVYDLPSFL